MEGILGLLFARPRKADNAVGYRKADRIREMAMNAAGRCVLSLRKRWDYETSGVSSAAVGKSLNLRIGSSPSDLY